MVETFNISHAPLIVFISSTIVLQNTFIRVQVFCINNSRQTITTSNRKRAHLRIKIFWPSIFIIQKSREKDDNLESNLIILTRYLKLLKFWLRITVDQLKKIWIKWIITRAVAKYYTQIKLISVEKFSI